MRSALFSVVLALIPYEMAFGEAHSPVNMTWEAPPKNNEPTPYIGKDQCDALVGGGGIGFRLVWTVPGQILWQDDVSYNVFLGTASKDCTEQPGVEVRGVGSDGTIAPGVSSGYVPSQGGIYTLSTGSTDFQGLLDAGKCNPQKAGKYFFCIKWRVDASVLVSQAVVYSGGAEFYFFPEPPAAPVIKDVASGDGSLKVSWDYDETTQKTRIKQYIVAHARVSESCSCPDPNDCPIDNCTASSEEIDDPATGSHKITGLTNGEKYYVWLRAKDRALNESEATVVQEATPQATDDFFEEYKNAGGQENGGYCFVATAAYGSCDHGMVVVLRALRDRVLAASSAGRGFIRSYYQFGPRWARAIRHSDEARAVARWSLLPLVGLSRAILWLQQTPAILWGLSLGALLSVGLALGWRHRRSRNAALLVLLVLASGSLALPSRSWAEEPRANEPSYQLQIRLGSYRPAVDEEDGLGSEKPFQKIYGSSGKILFELGLDYELFRKFGTLSLGGSAGFVQYVGKALVEGTEEKASDTTEFNILPMRLLLGYHFDVLQRWLSIPLVPYAQVGLSYNIWWILNGAGNTASRDGHDAAGGIWGYQVAGGVKLLLDAIDPETADNFQNEVGVHNTYFFAEYALYWIDNFGSDKSMHLGAENVMFGLMMEF